MFALLRHVGHASRYEIPPRPTALRQHLDADPAALQGTSPKRGPMFRALPNSLKSIHFSVLPVAGWVAVILLNEPAQDALRVLREEAGLATVLLSVAAVVWAALAW